MINNEERTLEESIRRTLHAWMYSWIVLKFSNACCLMARRWVHTAILETVCRDEQHGVCVGFIKLIFPFDLLELVFEDIMSFVYSTLPILTKYPQKNWVICGYWPWYANRRSFCKQSYAGKAWFKYDSTLTLRFWDSKLYSDERIAILKSLWFIEYYI